MEENFISKVAAAASKIEEILNQNQELSSWDIKLKLKLSSSGLYLALGYLAASGKIDLQPEDLNYRVKIKKNA